MNNTEPDIFEKIRTALSEDPNNIAWIALVIGAFLLAASVFHWKWVFKGHSYNTEKIEGISNTFGRRIARIVFGAFGLLCVIIGITALVI